MGDWITEEAARQAEEYSDDPATAMAESCLHAGDAHGYRRGLREAARQLEQQANRVRELFEGQPDYEVIVRTWDIAAAGLYVLAGDEPEP